MGTIQNKIKSLGGVKPLLKTEMNNNADNDIETIIDIMNDIPEIQVVNFIKEYGFSLFKNHVMIKPIDKSRFLSSGEIELGLIFGFGKGTNGISSAIEKYYSEDQINNKFFPLFEGYPGDIVFYSLEPSTKGEIYYWHHEADINDDKLLITKSFEEFISNLYAKAQEPEILADLSDIELNAVNQRRKKVGLPLIDKSRNIIS